MSSRQPFKEQSTHNTNDPRLASDMFAAPSEVTRVEPESTVLEVTTPDTNGVNPLRTELGVGGLTTELEFSLLAVVGALGTGVGAFVPGGAGYTWGCEVS